MNVRHDLWTPTVFSEALKAAPEHTLFTTNTLGLPLTRLRFDSASPCYSLLSSFFPPSCFVDGHRLIPNAQCVLPGVLTFVSKDEPVTCASSETILFCHEPNVDQQTWRDMIVLYCAKISNFATLRSHSESMLKIMQQAACRVESMSSECHAASAQHVF